MAEPTQAYYYIGNSDNVYTKVYDGSKLQANSMAYQGYLDDDSIVPQISKGSLTHVNEYGTMAYDETLGKNVGTLELHFDEGYPKVYRDGEDVTSEYNQTQVADSTFEDLNPGCMTFTIVSRDVTLKSANLTKEYDGKALTAYSQAGGTNVEDTTAGLTDKGYVSGEEFTYAFTGSQLFVGSSENTFTVSDSDTALTSDYNVTTKYGTLTVTARTSPLTITIYDQEKDYDGTETIQTAMENVTYTVDGLAYNDSITVTLVNTNVDAGFYEDGITATYTIMHDNGDGTYTDVTSMYANVTIDEGDLTINKCNVTITSGDATKEYDGTPLANDAVTATGFIGDDGIATATVTGSQTEVGASNNTFTYELKAGTKAENYDITTKPGTLVVTPVGATAVDPTVDPSAGTASVTLDAGETNDRYVQNVTAGTVATVTNESDKKLSVGAITANGDKAVVKNTGTGSMDIARVTATKGAVEIDNDATMKIETLSAATDVTIDNDGHLEASVLAGGELAISNASANTLIGSYTGETVNVTNESTGKAENVTLQAYGDQAEAGTITLTGEAGSTFTGNTKIVAGLNATPADVTANDGSGTVVFTGSNTFKDGTLEVKAATITGTSSNEDTITLNNVTATLNGAVTNNGTITIDSTSSITAASLTNTGSITLGYSADNALITVTGAFTGTEGTITVDMAGATEEKYLLIDGGEGSDYGEYKIVGGDTSGYSLSVEDNDLYAVKGVEPTPGKDYVVNSEWADKTYGDTILITKDDTIYSYTFGETAFSNVTGEDGVLTKIKSGKIITLYSDLSETGDFHIDKAYQVNLNGFDYEITGTVYDSITIRNSTDSANTFTGGTLCTADFGYFSVNGINTAVFDTVKNAGGTVYLYTTAMLKTTEWINEEAGAARGGRGEVYVFCPDLDETGEPVLTESFYKVIDQDSSTSLTISDYGWVGDDQGVTPSKGNYLWFYWKTGWEKPLPEGYKWATEDGDLVIIKYGEDAPTKLTAKDDPQGNKSVTNDGEAVTYVSDSVSNPSGDVVIEADEDSSEMKLTGDVTSTGGDVTITDKGESLHITGDVASDGTTTIVTDGAADAATVHIGGEVSGDTVVIENTKESGTSAVSADRGFAAETLEIRNETSETLSASGKLKVTDIRIYNNDTTSETKVGTVEITDQIEAAGKIEITNGSVLEGAGTVDLGTVEHTAQAGLAIVNRTANVINGGVSETGTELAANVTVASGDVTIENDGHINMNVDAANSYVKISNTSTETLITTVTGKAIAVSNSGAIKDSAITADSVTLGLNGTIDNTQITAGELTFSNAYQVVTFNWTGSKNFTFTQGFTVDNSQVVIDASGFTGESYRVIDNKTVTAEDYSNVILSDTTKGYVLVAKATEGEDGEGADLYIVKNTDAPTVSTELSNVYDDGTTKWIGTVNVATATVTVTDNSGSGIDASALKYSINGSGSYDYASGSAIVLDKSADEGVDVVYAFNAADNNGNTSSDTLTYRIDKSGPTIAAPELSAVGYEKDGVTWYKQGADVKVTATIEDALSGVKASALNGAAYASGAATRIETLYETAASGNEYTFSAVDNVGNEADVRTVTVGVDGTGPAIGAATLEGNSMLGNVSGQWIKAGTTATVATEITDELSGFKAAELEGSQYEGGKFTVTTLEGQDTEITGHQIVATDNVGNTSEKVVYYGVDGTGATFGAATLAGANVSGEWIKAGTAFTVAMAITDDKSGFSDANLEGVMYKDGKFSVTAGADDAEIAEHTVTASDNVGNLTTTTVSYGIDGTGPTIGEAKITGANVYQGTWIKAGSVFAVETEITDAKSGLAAAELDGAEYDGVKFALVAGEEGDVTTKIAATDMVGNVSELEVSYRVDGTGPTITVVSDPTDKLAKSVTLTATFTDSLSGLASAQYSFNGTDWLGALSGETITVSGITENKTVYFRATDNVGNVATTEYAVTNIVAEENPYVVDGITRVLAEDLYVSDFSVVNGGVVDGNEGKKLSANNLYLQNGTVKNVDGAIDNVIVQSGVNDISEMDDLVVKSSVTVESGELGLSKRQYDAFFDYLTVEADGELVVKDAGTVSQKEIEKLQTRASISEITFENAELAAINKLNFAASTKQKIGFEKLSGTAKADTITVNKNAQAVLTGAIDLGAGNDTLSVKTNGQLVLNGTLENVETVKLDGGSTYRENGSTYQKYTDLVAMNIAFSGDRAASFTTGNYTTASIAEVATGAKNDAVKIGSDSTFDVSGTLAFGAGTDTLTVGSRSAATFGAVTDVEKFTVSAGKAATKTTEAVLTTVNIGTLSGLTEDVAHTFKFGNYTSTMVNSGVTFGLKNDTVSLGNGATAMFAGDLKFGAGNDTLKIGADSAFQAVSLDFGTDGQTNQMTVGARSQVEVTDLMTGTLNKLTVTAGTVKSGTITKTTLKAGGKVEGTTKADTISLGNYTDVSLGAIDLGDGNDVVKIGNDAEAIIDLLDFGEGKSDSLTIGKNSTVTINDLDVDSLDKLTIGAGSTLYLGTQDMVNDALAKFTKYDSNQIQLASVA